MRLHTALGFDHQHPRRPLWVSHVLGAHRRVENIPDLQQNGLLDTVLAVAHLHLSIEHHKHFLAIVDVPFVWLVRPVQAGGDAIHVGNLQRRPGTFAGKRFAADDLHGWE